MKNILIGFWFVYVEPIAVELLKILSLEECDERKKIFKKYREHLVHNVLCMYAFIMGLSRVMAKMPTFSFMHAI